MKDLRNEEYQVLRDKAQPSAVGCSVLELKIPECLLAQDGQIGEAQNGCVATLAGGGW